jgi:protein SCO1/2
VTALRAIRYGLWAVVAVVAVGLGVLLVMPYFDRPSEGAVEIGGPFTLVDHNGQTVTAAALKGHPSLMFFGFTFCPDVCPTTLFEATNWLKALGPDADKLRFYFVTVDPERDTPQVMAEYLQAFDPRITGLTGSPHAVKQALDAFRVYSRKVPSNDGQYTMDHTAAIYLLDSTARFAGTITYQEPEEEVLPKIRKLIAGS